MLVEIVAFLLKMFASHYCFDFFHMFSMIIQFCIKGTAQFVQNATFGLGEKMIVQL